MNNIEQRIKEYEEDIKLLREENEEGFATEIANLELTLKLLKMRRGISK